MSIRHRDAEQHGPEDREAKRGERRSEARKGCRHPSPTMSSMLGYSAEIGSRHPGSAHGG